MGENNARVLSYGPGPSTWGPGRGPARMNKRLLNTIILVSNSFTFSESSLCIFLACFQRFSFRRVICVGNRKPKNNAKRYALTERF